MKKVAELNANVYQSKDIHKGGKDDAGTLKSVEMIVKLAHGVTVTDRITRNSRDCDVQIHGLKYEIKCNGGAIGEMTAKGDRFPKITGVDRVIYFPNITAEEVDRILESRDYWSIYESEHYIVDSETFLDAMITSGLLKYNTNKKINIQKFSMSKKRAAVARMILESGDINEGTL